MLDFIQDAIETNSVKLFGLGPSGSFQTARGEVSNCMNSTKKISPNSKSFNRKQSYNWVDIKFESFDVSNHWSPTKKTSPNSKRFTRRLSSDDEEEDLPPSKRQAYDSYQGYDVKAPQQSRFSVTAGSRSPAEIKRAARVAQLKNVLQLDEDVKTEMSRASPNGYESDLYNASPDQDSALFMESHQIHNLDRPDIFEVQSPPMFFHHSAFPTESRSVSVGLDDTEEKITEPPNMFSRAPSPIRKEDLIETDEDLHSKINSPVFSRQEEMFDNLSDTDSDALTKDTPLPSIEISSDDDFYSSDSSEANSSDHSKRNVNEPWNIEDRFIEVHELITATHHVMLQNHKSTETFQEQNSDQAQQIASIYSTIEILGKQARNQAEEILELRGEITKLKEENAGLARRHTELGDSLVELSEQIIHCNEQLEELRTERVSEFKQDASGVDKDEVTELKNEVARLNKEALELKRDVLKKEIEKFRNCT